MKTLLLLLSIPVLCVVVVPARPGVPAYVPRWAQRWVDWLSA